MDRAQRAQFERDHPDIFLLDAANATGIAEYLQGRSLMEADDVVQSVTPAGDGNMNCTLRGVTTSAYTRERIDREEKDEIIAQAKKYKAEHDVLIASLEHVMQALKEERERQGLSLADMKERTGIDRAALSRLESGQHPNPTIATLMRYAQALGKTIDVIVTEPA